MSVLDIFKRSKKDERDAGKHRERSRAKQERVAPQTVEVAETVTAKETQKQSAANAANLDIVPHISEKATASEGHGVYVFKIAPRYNRVMVREYIEKTHKVRPRMVTITNIPGKQVFVGRRRASRPGYKKAIVYLKKGDTISI